MSPTRTTLRFVAPLALACALTGCTMGHDASLDRPTSSTSTSNGTSSNSPSSPQPSSSQQSAKQIWSAAQAKLAKATSVKVDGTDSPDGTGPSIVFSGKLSGDPTEVVFKDATLGNFTMRRIGDTTYLKGDKKYWDAVEKHGSDGKGASRVANRWIAIPTSQIGKDDLTKLVAKTYIGNISDASDPKWGAIADPGAQMSTEKISGRDATKIVSPDHDTTVWVARDGSSELLQVRDEAAGSDDLGKATFSRWNDEFAITKPSDAIGDKGSEPTPATPDATT